MVDSLVLGQFFTKEPVEDYTDLGGIKIRIASKLVGDLLTANNAVPVFMPFSDVYEALSKGVVDGYSTSIPSISSEKFYEVVNYVHMLMA